MRCAAVAVGAAIALVVSMTGPAGARAATTGAAPQAAPMVAPRAAAEAGQQFYALQWNIAGATEHDGDPNEPNNAGSGEVIDRLVSFVETWRPSVISVNEVCSDQVRYLRNQLADAGIQVQAWDFAPTEFNGFCLNYVGEPSYAGPALLSLVPAHDPKNIYFDDDTNQIVNKRTSRAGACMTLEFTENVRTCSFHLAKDHSAALAEAQEFATTYHDDIAAYPYMLLGDFNNVPSELLSPMYDPSVGGGGQFYEADMDSPNLGLPTISGKKYDYAFVNNQYFSRDDLATAVLDPGTCEVYNYWEPPVWVRYPHPCSDHSAIVASIVLKFNSAGGGYPQQPPATDSPPSVSAGPDVSGVEGSPIQLNGSASDDHGTPSVTWHYYALDKHDVDSGATCSFADPHAVNTTITCTDDGTFGIELVADDGVNATVGATATLTLSNAPPKLTLTGPRPWQVYHAGDAVHLGASFTDPGTNDTHTCTVDWDDGTTESYEPRAGTCDRDHTFAHPGMYTIKTTVTDDDGASDTADVMVVVYDPNAGFVTTGAHIDSPAGALASDPAATGSGSFEFNPEYKPSDEGPVPGGGKVHFKLDAGSGLDFDATSLEWLVVTPDDKAVVKGTGTIGGQGQYGFVLYGYDGDPDKLRIVVWPLSEGPIPSGTLTYDNRRGAGFDMDVAQPQDITSGSVQVHN